MTLRKHYVATAYVYDRKLDSFLFVLHKKLGKWLPPGGHLHEGEEPHKGMQRELFEETGVEGRIVDLLHVPKVATQTAEQLPTPFCVLSEVISTHSEDEQHVHIDFVYVVEIDLSKPLHLCTEEVTHAKWVNSRQIDQLETYENVKQVCRSIRSRISQQNNAH